MISSSSQHVSGSYFTLVHRPSYQNQKCIPPRRVHLINTPSIKTSPPTLPAKKKSVRFCSDEDLEQVRLFIKTQTPLSVHSDPPPMLTTTRLDIQYPNWPSKWSMYKSLASAMIRMENVQLVENKVLVGRCRVANMAFEKQVMVRYSLDHWKSYKEIKASFRESLATISSPRSWDRFTFDIDLPEQEEEEEGSSRTINTCWIALCYHVNQQEFWDNNDGKNYQINLVPISTTPSTPPLQLSDTDDDDEDEDDVDSVPPPPTILYPETFTKEPSPSSSPSPSLPSSSPQHALNQLKSRYSFSNAPPSKRIVNITTTTTTTSEYQPSSSLNHTLSSVPQLGYQDFISKYCFYNSSIAQN